MVCRKDMVKVVLDVSYPVETDFSGKKSTQFQVKF